MGAVLDKVIGPDMVRTFGSQTDARPVVQPEPSFLSLLLRHFKPLTPPDPLDPLMVHTPACVVEQTGDCPVAIAAILARQLDDVCGQLTFIAPALWNLSLLRTVLTKSAASAAFGYAEVLPDLINALATTRRA